MLIKRWKFLCVKNLPVCYVLVLHYIIESRSQTTWPSKKGHESRVSEVRRLDSLHFYYRFTTHQRPMLLLVCVTCRAKTTYSQRRVGYSVPLLEMASSWIFGIVSLLACMYLCVRGARRIFLIFLALSFLFSLRATRRFFGGIVPLIRNGCLSHVAWGTLFFIFFIGSMMFELTFESCKNSKTATGFLPEFSSLKRDVRVG